MASSTYALYALEALLDEPEKLTRDRDHGDATLRASWECGCVARGSSVTSLGVTPCGTHAELFES